MSLPVLNASLLPRLCATRGEPLTPRDEWPERVIQFGEGNFLRAFVDWMFDKLNKNGRFHGRIAVVQPIERGMADRLNAQDGPILCRRWLAEWCPD